jgi:DNA sulfur modification protein DndC
MSETVVRRKSFFDQLGFTKAIAEICDEITSLYLADTTPWVIGYSGGKDSTAVTQLVWTAISRLEPAKKNHKPVYVITTDTLVENPVVAAWVRNSLVAMQQEAQRQQLPFFPELLEPPPNDSFWVNLIGRGYPAPRPGFRWCTERLKIKPTSRFIENTASRYGEAILLIGARKAESATRSASLSRRQSLTKEGLTAHPDLVSTLVYAPIQEWSNDDVWTFLMRAQNPWGISNKDLMSIYRGATEDNECPIVVDTTTPSCGNSRFGCWVCTLVEQDKSMKAMIQNDSDKSWMRPLLDLRNELDFRGDTQRQKDIERREFRRMSGTPTINRTGDALIPGPYTQESRAEWLRKVLAAQTEIRNDPKSPEHVKAIELITPAELEAIRRIWVTDKNEIEDLLPTIYEEATGLSYPVEEESRSQIDRKGLVLLREVAGDDRLHYETVRNLLAVEATYRSTSNVKASRGLFKELQSVIEKGYFKDADDAFEWAKSRDIREPEIESAPAESVPTETIAEKEGLR